MDEIFDESHYFVCSGGLKPASMKSNQNIVKREDGKYYLTEYSLKCYAIDFSCKWVALLYAIVAAALALLLSCPAGWVLLAAIIGAGVGAALGAAMCGDMAAIMRVWVAIKTDAQLGEHNAVANKPGVHMICNAFSGQITYVPNKKTEFHALVLFAGNTLMTGLEGFMYVYAFRGAGMLITKPLQFFANFGVNYLKTVSVAGFAGRTVFGAWGGFSAYSNSSTEGFHAEEVFTDAGKSFGFAEMAAYHAVTERDPQSIALLLSLGGIPGGTSGKDANGLADVKAAGNAVAEGWKNTGEKVANQISNKINTAKEFRERLKGQKKGSGAFTKGKTSYLGFGGDIILDPNKTTTVIGKFIDPIDGFGTQEILKMPDGSFTRGEVNKGGINILDIPSDKYEGLLRDFGPDIGKEMFWDQYNQPFLENAFKNGDNVRVLSDPHNPANRTGFYERELREIDGYKDIHGKDIPGLAERYGYKYDPLTNTYIKE